MKTITSDQFNKRYGMDAASSFDQSNKIDSPVEEAPRTPASANDTSIPSQQFNSAKEGISQFGKGFEQVGEGLKTGDITKVGRGVLNEAAGGLNTAFSPITGMIKAGANAPGVKQAVEAVKKYVVDPAADVISDAPALQKFMVENPNADEVVNNIITIAMSMVGGKGGKAALENSALKTETAAIKPPTTPSGPLSIPTKNVSSGLMDRVARINPKDATKFADMSGGKTVGDYLVETGNFGAPDKIISKEAVKFTESKASVDAELAKLPGVYKPSQVGDALNALLEKAKSVSSDNVSAPWLREVEGLKKKYDAGGLTMGEINQTKRLFESKVRLGYNKLMNADKVEQATNIDNSIRKWQVQKASDLGFNNIAELNKQTQLSRFLVDKLGDKVVGQGMLNGVSLTDWIVLGGGSPTAVAGFLTKKFFSSRAVQAKIAEWLNMGEDVRGLITPEVNPTVENTLRKQFPEGTRLELPEGRSPVSENRVPIQAGPASSMEAPAKQIFNESMK